LNHFYPFLYHFFLLSLKKENHSLVKLFYQQYIDVSCLDLIHLYIRKYFSERVEYNSKEENENFIHFISDIFPQSRKLLNMMWNEFQMEEKSFQSKVSIKLLSKHLWPTSTEYCHLNDEEIRQEMKLSHDNFLKQFPGKTMNWQYQYGNCTLKLNGFDKKYEITCSTFQMSILLLFNEMKEVTLSEMKEMTNLKKETLLKELKPILEIGLLTTHPGVETISLEENFKFNKIKIKFY
jgi:hypothetical protein